MSSLDNETVIINLENEALSGNHLAINKLSLLCMNYRKALLSTMENISNINLATINSIDSFEKKLEIK